MNSPEAIQSKPVLGFVLIGGSLSGALVRDVRLANEVSKRGYPVHVWWALDKDKTSKLRPEIQQHWLFHGMRFHPKMKAMHGVMEGVGHGLHAAFADVSRAHQVQKRPHMLARIMEHLLTTVCDGVEQEAAVVKRFARDLQSTGVTHVLPMLEMLCPWVDAARKQVARPVKYVVTFQGYELYSTYARSIGRERALYDRLIETVAHSDWPAIAVSADYLERVVEEVGVQRARLAAIPPGVPAALPMDAAQAQAVIKAKLPKYDPSLPVVTFLGRRDVEKGIDLLLYAAALLRRAGHRFQLAICGPSLWGDQYGLVCKKIAEDLRCPVLWRRFVEDEVRSALFSISRCVVYPSIHREPFGMVAAEVVAHGTPAIVPDYGGVASAIEANGEIAGLRFKVWDSGDLAAQIERLLTDDALHARLSAAGPRVAKYFSIENLADRVLNHIGLPAQNEGTSD